MSPHEHGRTYTRAARGALDRAAEYSAQWGHAHTSPLGLLLALIDDNTPGMAAILLERHTATITVRRAIATHLRSADSATETIDTCLDHAEQENPTRPLGTDHLLLGLLMAGTAAADVLAVSGMTLDQLRATRSALGDTTCYGCAEADPRPSPFTVPTANLPTDLAEVLAEITHWRHRKEQAVDASNFELAAQLRHSEKQAHKRIADWDQATQADRLGTAIDEILRLQTALAHLTTLLHSGHGIST
ncbi:Clp protease N-terminal domain-containing protein [Nocardia sp. NPDC058705]|uniref:Clp protease N-terminal domain-containing protein n=1 Tax=Nocardia sp. NPDC058705 TaxID=3346609 RepID=UPI0036C20829